jgi:hypothetical protein
MTRLIAALVLALLIPSQVLAADSSITGTATYSHPLFLVAEGVAGTATAHAMWEPKNGVRYGLTLKHLTDPSDPYSYDAICQVYEPLDGSGSGQTVGAINPLTVTIWYYLVAA